MSDQNNEITHPILTLLGKAFIFAIPASLVVMLGAVGFAFLSGSGVKVAEEREAVQVASAAVTTAEPAATAMGEPAVAATATAGGGSS